MPVAAECNNVPRLFPHFHTITTLFTNPHGGNTSRGTLPTYIYPSQQQTIRKAYLTKLISYSYNTPTLIKYIPILTAAHILFNIIYQTPRRQQCPGSSKLYTNHFNNIIHPHKIHTYTKRKPTHTRHLRPPSCFWVLGLRHHLVFEFGGFCPRGPKMGGAT